MRLALALSLALFACGGGSKPAATTPAAAPEAEPATATEAAPAEAPRAPEAASEPAAAAEPAMAPAAPAPTVTPTTRGAQRKPAPKAADPCAGGE